MGPTPFSVGYVRASQIEGRHGRASMGPTPFSVGYARQSHNGGQSQMSFNGANAFQRWIQRGRCQDDRRMGALQWGQRLSALDTGRHTDRRENGGIASMGPTPFSVGYSLFAALFAYCSAFRRRMSSFCARVFLLDAESRRFSPVRAAFRPLFCERPFLGGSPPERSQRRLGDFAGFTRAGGGAYSDVKERRAPRYARRALQRQVQLGPAGDFGFLDAQDVERVPPEVAEGVLSHRLKAVG